MKESCFFQMFFYLAKLTVFLKNWQQSDVRTGNKKTHVFLVMRGLA